jgi:hypothetical protein
MAPEKTATESPRRLLLLLGLAVVLAGAAAWDWWARPGADGEPAVAAVRAVAPRPDKAAPAAEAGTETNGPERGAHALASLALDELHDTVRRPLFEKTRRPVEPPARAVQGLPLPVQKRQADPGALTLYGVLVNEGHGAIALLRRNQTGQNVRLEVGDAVDGWTIERIETDSVQLVQGDARVTLELFRKR